ncbi:unnamed protein product [Rotaria magnacalcarata]|uniref:mRNA guanylyltransferase n=2 Tax=Rotaria magnacalcarata TaxID=392030 RepID=A0A819LHL1_9BILA|nr:unnamed protein product [Rotaria magnacalcarata]CAF1942595.1 unnamed protein product [Rotaria magnacalcarata]CAF2005467.1 unnamed protein product [Rotaria magnacalcarata]CAF2133637.1 unnamed protein product [Rotaria magnacalcarata]CAF3961111.1 unnamed protein product [Rotaria magnacalcarata]
MIGEGNHMCYREKQAFHQSPARTDDEDKHIQDVISRDGYTLESTGSYTQIQDESTISELEQELINGMKKLEILDVDKLPEKIQQTEQRIKDYPEDDREKHAEKEIQVLRQLQHLTLVDGTITTLKSSGSVEDCTSALKHCRLDQQLVNGLEKLKILDENKLPEKIQQTEQRIKDYREDDTEKGAKEQMQILSQLQHLTLVDDTIKKLKSTRSVEGSSILMKPGRLQQESSAIPKFCLTSSDQKVESNDQPTTSGGNKRSNSNYASDQSAKRCRAASPKSSTPQFFVPLRDVVPVCVNPLMDNIRNKYRRLCGWTRRGFPGTHPVCMHRGNYDMILQSSYLISWKSVGKRYMMLIEDKDKVYMLDQGDNLFSVDHIQFPCDAEYTSHLKDTLVDGEFIIDNADGSNEPSFWINDIITYNGQNVSKKTFPQRLTLIFQSIVNIRNKAIGNGHIKKATQPFSIRNKYFFGLSEVNNLLSRNFIETIPHEIDGLLFLPEKDAYKSGECLRVLKWKENETIEFRLKITVNSSKISGLPEKNADLFLNHENDPYATMRYLPNLEQYDNKIISCSYKDSQWHFHRLRDDRPCPNSKQTAKSVIDAVKRPVTRETLCGLRKDE